MHITGFHVFKNREVISINREFHPLSRQNIASMTAIAITAGAVGIVHPTAVLASTGNALTNTLTTMGKIMGASVKKSIVTALPYVIPTIAVAGTALKFFGEVEDNETVTLCIIPDRTLTNKANYKLVRALHEIYESPAERLSMGKWFIRYRPASRIWYDVVLEKDQIRFYVTISKKWETYARQKISTCWPRAEIQQAEPRELEIPVHNTKVCELVYKRHNIFALHVNLAEDTLPLNSILSVTNDMEEDDIARLSICFDPNNRLSWQDTAKEAHKKFAKGATPQRKNLSARKMGLSIGKSAESLFAQVGDLLLNVMGNDTSKEKKNQIWDTEKMEILIEGKLEPATNAKKVEPTFDTRIRTASYSKNPVRRELTSRALSTGYVDVAGDNELERIEISNKKTATRMINELNFHKLSLRSVIELDTNVMSSSELGKLAQLPSAGLQDVYADKLETINQRVDKPPAAVTKPKIGISYGKVEYKTGDVEIFKPINNLEEFCLPDVDIGGMGTGKTKGIASNLAVEITKAGHGGCSIDPAMKEMGAQIKAGLVSEQIVHYDLSKQPIGLDWRESYHATNMTTRLANTILSFFNMNQTEFQTERYLFASIMAMQTRKLGEILKIFEDETYRKQVIDKMPENINKTSLKEFDALSDAKKQSVLAPILNRMAVLLRDPYLSECLNCDTGIDFWEHMQKNQFVIIDVPDSAFDPLQKNIIIQLLISKINTAMRLRPRNCPKCGHQGIPAHIDDCPACGQNEEELTIDRAFVVIMDEPHQYLKSADMWRDMCVEGRKYRCKFVWLFHSWEQLPDELGEMILSAGPHFHIFRSSAKTYQTLKHFLLPYELDDIVKMPLHHCISVLRVNKETTPPFLARMMLPPLMQKAKKEQVDISTTSA